MSARSVSSCRSQRLRLLLRHFAVWYTLIFVPSIVSYAASEQAHKKKIYFVLKVADASADARGRFSV